MTHLVSPLIHRIARDRRLSSKDLHVWISVAAVIGVEEFVPVKLEAIARDLECHRATVHRCLHRLATLGYLDRACTRRKRGTMAYRLPREIHPMAEKAE